MTASNNDSSFYTHLAQALHKTCPDRVDELRAFAKRLFKLAPIRELESEPIVDLAGMVLGLRLFMDSFDGAGPKVRSFNPNLEEDGWEHRHTQIVILQRDMAFLVDSARMALSRHGLGIHGINSTVFDVVRSRDGHLQEIVVAPVESSHREALIYFQVDHYVSPEQHKAIIDEIRDVLASVSAVNQAYSPCIDSLNQVVENVRGVYHQMDSVLTAENVAFLEWLRDNHFTFLAYSYYSLSGIDDPIINHVQEKTLGLFSHRPRTIESARLSQLPSGLKNFYQSDEVLALAKSSIRSRVHRDAYCDYVIVKDFDHSGRVIGEHRFLGLYTSLVYSQNPFEIPLVRLKLRRIYDRSGLNATGHYGKVLRQIIEVHPREELFHGSEDQLYEILLGIWQINERRLVKLFVRPDPFNKFINCIVFFPRDSYRTEIREKAEQLLVDAFDATESQFSTFFSESSLARTHFVMRISSDRYLHVSVDDLERQIAGFTNNWRDDLHLAIIEHWGDEQGIVRSEMYRTAFPVSYQDHFDPRTAVHDIALFDGLVDEQEIAMSFFQPPDVDRNIIRFKIFHLGSELPLSRVVPMLENLGFLVIGEHPYPLSPAHRPPVWVHDFNLNFSLDMDIDVPLVRENFIDAFSAVWHGLIDDDSFNWLVIGARLDWRSVALLRAYARYMKQLGISISQDFIATTLAHNLEITRNLIALFKTRFDPKLGSQDPDKSDRASRLEQKILAALDDVRNLNQDQVLRTYLGLVCATVRTNFYQRDESGEVKNCIAFKLKPRALTFVPEPKPEFEIFVYSARVEGVHLRAGKVARGGIRWSDRFEDYRTEILGLVKAQQVKNAVIVPTGAKGGFVAKKINTNAGRDERFQEGQACYALFIQGLLDITDNIVDGQVVPPPELVRLDEDDPYLVVAADKGTATFSDLANSISNRYGHWLNDAFASGGSHGYDHKKMAITAKGAWVAVQRHFREMGINPQTESITVVGIGDMSGDVFGNGMLLSPCIRLVAAFNHNAIFIDPNPNVESAYRERQRLFALPSSNWTDYNPEIVSAGGGVFLRSEKAIRISAEMAAAFAIVESELTPDKLIKTLLKSPVDLLWNGGIGTYVKSHSESHLDVGDRNNDNLRINGRELRCKVFAEGGNLGITQKGRVEFCLAGGRCNTDFIDNSGGVDCSDQEVNIKIALNRLVANEDLTGKQRNQLLEDMTAEVAERVLHHNYRQTQAISLACMKAQEDMSEFLHCITDWEATGLISRSLENLPDDETLADREKNNLRLARPELAVLLSYSKILFKRQLLETDIAQDSVVEAEIFKIFPTLIVERYPQALRDHALKSEVICNHLANEILDLMGLTFVHRQMKSTGAGADDIVRAYLIVRQVLDFEAVWREIEALDHQLDWPVQADLLLNLMHLGRRTTRWVIRNRRTCVNIQAEVLSLKPILGNLLASSIDHDQDFGQHQEGRFNELRQLGLNPYAAMLIDSAGDLFYAFGMADVAIRTGATMGLVREVYAELGDMLQLEWLSQQIIDLPSENRWEDFAREAFVHELENQYRALAVTMVEELANPDELSTRLHHWQASQASLVERWNDMIAELKAAPVHKYTMFSVALQVLRDLVDTTRQQGNLADFCALPSQ